MSSLQNALSIIREKANNDTELGSAFERLTKVFLENDATQTQQYSKVWHYSDWAREQEGYATKDIGIDLVAKLRDEDGYCAIQCKFYQSEHSISKADLDSFISASASSDFSMSFHSVSKSRRAAAFSSKPLLTFIDFKIKGITWC